MSHQIASGTGNIQILVKESENIRVEINGKQAVSLWVPSFRQPLPQTSVNKDLALLLATTGLTDLVGREHLWLDFFGWCMDSGLDPISAVCVTGPGGSGKTRFALEMVYHLRKIENWDARFVRFDKSEPFDLWDETRGPNHVLLVFDYAPDNAVAIASSLRLLAENPPKDPERRLRVLLLARAAALGSGWLLPFEPASTLEAGRSPRDLFRRGAEIIELSPISDHDRVRIFMQAYQRAAAQLELAECPVDQAVFQARHAKEALRDPLTLIMAAIVGLKNGVPNALSLSHTQLAHEAAHLLVERRLQTAFSDNPSMALHMVAYATLVGGIPTNEALQVLEVESGGLHLGRIPDPSSFVARLAAWFPGRGADLIGAIEPDIVGEAHVLSQLSSRGEKAAEVLSRAMKVHPVKVVQTLIRTVQDYSLVEDEIDPRPLYWLRDLIEPGDTDDTQLLVDINAAFPESSVALRKETLSVREKLNEHLFRLAAHLENLDQRAKRLLPMMQAVSLNLLSTAQSEMGLLGDALENARKASTLAGELADQDPLVFNKLRAQYLNDLGNRQRDLAQHDAALRNYEESVRLLREILDRDQEAMPSLAKALNNLGISLRALGRLDESLQSAEEAISLYRKLIEGNRDEFLPVFAGLLANLSNSESSVGRRVAALASAKESHTYFRELAERNRDAHLPGLARALSNLGVMQSEVGQIEEALASTKEAVRLLRGLIKFDRGVFLLDLSVALNNLAGREASSGHREDALSNAREAVGITRELLGRDCHAFIFDHTKSCGRLGLILAEFGLYAEAADAFAEGFRDVLPSLENAPRLPLVRQAYLLCAGYLQVTEKGGIDRDWLLLARAMPILRPHLEKLGVQNDLPD